MDQELLTKLSDRAAGYGDDGEEENDPAMRWGRLGMPDDGAIAGPQPAMDAAAIARAVPNQQAAGSPEIVDMSSYVHQPGVLGQPPKPMLGYVPPGPEPAGNSLGMKLAVMGKPPALPQPDPNYQATMQHRRSLSTATPRYDANGNVLPQYRLGAGGRILRGVTDFFTGGIPGVLMGAVRPDTPGSYGKGAVNNHYYQDESARQQALESDDAKLQTYQQQYADQERNYGRQREAYNDEARKAYEQDVQERQRASDEEKARHNMETEDLRQQMNDMKQQTRSITYDRASGQFMRGANVYTPQNIEEGATLEAQAGIRGPYTQRWQQERRNQPENRQKPLSALEQRKLESYAREHNLKSIDQLSNDQIKEALQARRKIKGR